MSKLNDERWAFKVEHFDPAADLVRQYELLYYLGDSTLEMVRPDKNPLQTVAHCRPMPLHFSVHFPPPPPQPLLSPLAPLTPPPKDV